MEQLRDAERVAEWRAATVLRPSPGPPARDRVQALLERVRQREAAAIQERLTSTNVEVKQAYEATHKFVKTSVSHSCRIL